MAEVSCEGGLDALGKNATGIPKIVIGVEWVCGEKRILEI